MGVYFKGGNPYFAYFKGIWGEKGVGVPSIVK